MTLFLNDTMAGADGALLSSHVGETGAAWTKITAGSASPIIFNNRLRFLASDTVGYTVWKNSVSAINADSYVEANIYIPEINVSSSCGVMIRVSNATSTGYLCIYSTASLAWKLYRMISGTPTEIASYPVSLKAMNYYRVRLTAIGVGSTVSLYVDINGINLITFNDADAARIISPGRAAIWLNCNGSANGGMSIVMAGEIDSISARDTSGEALTAGVASFVSSTTSSITVAMTMPFSGTRPYTYEWRRLANANDAFETGTVVGGNALSVIDSSSLIPNKFYFYQCKVVDSAGSPATAYSSYCKAVLKNNGVAIGFIGDSITAGQGLTADKAPPSVAADYLKRLPHLRDVIAVNNGVPGSATVDWITDAPGENIFIAKQAFASAGVSYVHISLGLNDAGIPLSAADYKTNLVTICSNLIGAGYKVVLSHPTVSRLTMAANNDLNIQYRAQVDSLINGNTILKGDTTIWQWLINNVSSYQSDWVHSSVNGAVAIGESWGSAIGRALRLGSGLASITLNLVNTANSPMVNLTGLKWAWWDDVTPDLLSAPTYSGNIETTDGSGVLTINLPNSLKSSGQIGWLVITDSDGTTTQSPAHKCFSGPVAIS